MAQLILTVLGFCLAYPAPGTINLLCLLFELGHPWSQFLPFLPISIFLTFLNYKYLGITINENLSFEKARTDLAESAGRALSGIITKMIKNGGFPFNVYTILYESCVCSITDYGSEVLGFSEYQATEKVHNKAARAYLGLGRSTPIPGMRVEMGWLEPRSRTQARMIRMLHRLVCMDSARLTKKIFLWDQKLTETSEISTWGREVRDILTRNNLQGVFYQNIFDLKVTIETLKSSLSLKDQV